MRNMLHIRFGSLFGDSFQDLLLCKYFFTDLKIKQFASNTGTRGVITHHTNILTLSDDTF